MVDEIELSPELRILSDTYMDWIEKLSDFGMGSLNIHEHRRVANMPTVSPEVREAARITIEIHDYIHALERTEPEKSITLRRWPRPADKRLS